MCVFVAKPFLSVSCTRLAPSFFIPTPSTTLQPSTSPLPLHLECFGLTLRNEYVTTIATIFVAYARTGRSIIIVNSCAEKATIHSILELKLGVSL